MLVALALFCFVVSRWNQMDEWRYDDSRSGNLASMTNFLFLSLSLSLCYNIYIVFHVVPWGVKCMNN